MINEVDERILTHITEYKALTIKQCHWLFYKDAKFGADLARKKLKRLADKGFLKYYENDLTKERVYCMNLNKRVSSHDLITMDFYAYMCFLGVETINFKRNVRLPHCFPDAVFSFTWKGKKKFIFVEIDLTHNTKVEKYEKLYQEGVVQKEFKTFPDLIVLTRRKERKLESKHFNIIKMDYNFDNIDKVLGPVS